MKIACDLDDVAFILVAPTDPIIKDNLFSKSVGRSAREARVDKIAELHYTAEMKV